MKNIFYSLLSGLAFMALLGACKTTVNDQFEGLDSLVKPANLAAYTYTLVDADYAVISKSALAVAKNNADSTAAKSIATNKYFNNTVPSSTNVPFLLSAKYPYSDLGSTANITSSFGVDRPAYLANYANASPYTLTKADYAFSGSDVLGFYPNVTPATFVTNILAANVPAPVEGNNELVKYVQYLQTPVVTTTANYLLDESFGYGAAAGNLTSVTTNWTAHSGAGSAMVGYSATSLSMTGYPSSGIGGSATISLTGVEDINRTFTPQTTGTVYASALINLSAVGAGAYFLHFMDDAFGYPARITAKDNGSGKILFGIGAGSTLTYGTNAYDLNKTYLLVASYNLVSGVSNLYVLQSAVATEPGSPEVTSTVSPITVMSVQKIGIRQATGGPAATIDGIRVATTWKAIMANDIATTITGNKMNREVYYQYTGGKWVASQGIYVVTTEDYQSMGTATGQPGKYSNFDSTMPPENFLPTLLTKLFPYAQNGNKQIIAYKYYSGTTQTRVDEYIFNNAVWSKPSSITSGKEQYIFSKSGWVFDPTIKLALVRLSGNNPYIMKFIDYVRTTTPAKFFQNGTYINEEHYYGFSAYYAEIVCTADRTTYGDPAIKALTSDVAKNALFLDRVKEAMPIFTQVNYPNLTMDVSGIQQYVIVTIITYYSSSRIGNLTIKMKCTKSGTSSTPAEYVVDSFTETF